jgi:hypothetical protein
MSTSTSVVQHHGRTVPARPIQVVPSPSLNQMILRTQFLFDQHVQKISALLEGARAIAQLHARSRRGREVLALIASAVKENDLCCDSAHDAVDARGTGRRQWAVAKIAASGSHRKSEQYATAAKHLTVAMGAAGGYQLDQLLDMAIHQIQDRGVYLNDLDDLCGTWLAGREAGIL